MNAWWETAMVSLLIIFGILGSLLLSKRPKAWWISGYCLSLVCIIAFILARYVNGLEFVRPFSWLATGRTRYAMTAIIIPLLLIPVVAQIPKRRLQYLLGAFGLLALFQYSLNPFLEPAMPQATLLSLKTKIDSDGICLQQTAYTCGPAAAVTALRLLGLPAEEGALSVWARTSSSGTVDDLLADALQSHYRDQGLTVHLRHFKTISELGHSLPLLAVVKYDLFVDHFVTVLKVTDKQVIVGDPLSGQSTYSHQAFAEIWRHSGIVLQRTDSQPRPDR